MKIEKMIAIMLVVTSCSICYSHESGMGGKFNSKGGSSHNNIGSSAFMVVTNRLAEDSQQPQNKGVYIPGYSTHKYDRAREYGSTFGPSGLSSNSYIRSNHYTRVSTGIKSPFLSNELFSGEDTHRGNFYGSYNKRLWDFDDDRRWRGTTKAPYFENKIPGSDSYLPAAAVVGAATAFGLTSLLPLNVPPNKPLMYCNTTDIAQLPTRINNKIYSCVNNKIAISCNEAYENAMNDDKCVEKTMVCDDAKLDVIYCKNATLLSLESIFCDSTSVHDTASAVTKELILHCFHGKLPDKETAFIPTTTAKTPITTTTEKQLSVGAKVHVFLLNLIGQGHVAEPKLTASSETSTDDTQWYPEALTVPPRPY